MIGALSDMALLEDERLRYVKSALNSSFMLQMRNLILFYQQLDQGENTWVDVFCSLTMFHLLFWEEGGGGREWSHTPSLIFPEAG